MHPCRVERGESRNLANECKWKQALPLAVDRHLGVGRESEVVDLGDVSDLFHVGSVATGTEDDTGLGRTVDVGRGDQSTGRVVNQSDKRDRNVLNRHGGDMSSILEKE